MATARTTSARSLPSFDLRSLDLSKLDLSKLDFTKLDVSKLQLPTIDLPGIDAERVRTLVRDAAYVAIGLGVLTVQQANLRRRELVARLSDSPVTAQLGIDTTQVEELVSRLEDRLVQVDERFEALEDRLDHVVEAIEDRLPEQAGQLLGQAHEIAKAARKQVRGLIRSAA